MKKPKIYVGGQAVIEGVMMRSPKTIATAVRTPSGEITVKKEAIRSISERFPILKKPFLRGTVALVESLIYGMKSLSYSAQAAGEEEEQLSSWQMALTMAVSVLLAIVFSWSSLHMLLNSFPVSRTVPFGLTSSKGFCA